MERRTFLLAGAAAATGCMRQATKANPFEDGAGATSIRVDVENRNFNQATLETLGTVQRRLGIVGGHARQRFTLAWPADGNLRIRIDLLAGARYTTNSVSLKRGDAAYLTIENPVQRSYLRR
ncbi:MAG: hypothetical protein OXT72_06285 [Gammaproteobacteria bacterium]|nr:hypothetical protein [Gammaproteobacteria bacterium]MDE2875044.1 hypothetical protein [Gemmatimonadota bacterium]